MAGDHQVLVRFYHISRNAALRCANAILMFSIGSLVQFQSEPCTCPADGAPYRGRILADPGGEDDAIETAERRGERCNVAGDAIAKQLDREAGTYVVTGQELAEIRRNTGKPQHARALIE